MERTGSWKSCKQLGYYIRQLNVHFPSLNAAFIDRALADLRLHVSLVKGQCRIDSDQGELPWTHAERTPTRNVSKEGYTSNTEPANQKFSYHNDPVLVMHEAGYLVRSYCCREPVLSSCVASYLTVAPGHSIAVYTVTEPQVFTEYSYVRQTAEFTDLLSVSTMFPTIDQENTTVGQNASPSQRTSAAQNTSTSQVSVDIFSCLFLQCAYDSDGDAEPSHEFDSTHATWAYKEIPGLPELLIEPDVFQYTNQIRSTISIALWFPKHYFDTHLATFDTQVDFVQEFARLIIKGWEQRELSNTHQPTPLNFTVVKPITAQIYAYMTGREPSFQQALCGCKTQF